MPDQQPDTPTPAADTGPDVEKQLAALTAQQEALSKQEAAFKEHQDKTINTLQTIADRVAPVVADPDPEPEVDLNELEGTEQVAEMIKRGFQAYHESVEPSRQRTDRVLFEAELDRVKVADPKNFDRLKTEMGQYFNNNPGEMVPGRAQEVFTHLRGMRYEELRKMDAADLAQGDPVPDPNPAVTKTKGDTVEYDTLNEEEAGVARGMGVDPKEYFKSRYGREMVVKE